MKRIALYMFAVMAFCFPSVVHAADGTPIWTNIMSVFNGVAANGLASPHAITLDSSGNVFAAGYTLGTQSNSDFETVKYSPSGTVTWVRALNNLSANGIDAVNAIAVDGSGNVYVTGKSAGVGTGYDFLTVQYSGGGTLNHQIRYNDSLSNDDIALGISVDPSGDVYVTGQSYVTATSSAWRTIKYSSSFAGVWTNSLNGAGNGLDQPKAIATDTNGNVYVTGYYTRIEGDFDFLTVKYTSGGTLQWANSYNGAFNSDDLVQSLALDTDGNVYVTGVSTGTGGSFDYVTIKYSNAGAGVWTNIYNGPGNTDDEAVGLALDPGENVYVTGTSIGPGGSYGYVTIKYASNGVSAWTNFFNGVGNRGGQASALAVDASGNAFVTGTAYGGLRPDDFVTIKYSTAGTAVWTNFFSGGPANAMALDTNGNVYVTGGNGNFTTIKYASVLGSSILSFVTTNGNFGPVNNKFVMSLVGPAGSNTVISESSNLQNWSPIATNQLTPSTLQVTDSAPPISPQRFYRAQLQ